MVGVSNMQATGSDRRLVDPILIKKVVDDTGTILYEVEKEERLILSQELAFLLTHILKDTAARSSILGQSSGFELSQSFAVMNSVNESRDLSWTIGYTPSRVFGVWLGDTAGDHQVGIIDYTHASTLWHALMKFITQNLPLENWEIPSGIVGVDICSPSGLLSTEFCPDVVEELFLEGTEPIHYDALYKPFLVNKETGKLATLFTPFDQVEEKIYFVAPADAMEWAWEAGFPQPPNEYDSLDIAPEATNVKIDIPRNFDILCGRRWISGRTNVDGFHYFRLLYGKGLNPNYWFQIGEDSYKSVIEGTLALWDTQGLDGLYTLQLLVVDQDGIAHISTKYVTIDNQRPEVVLLCPELSDRFHLETGQIYTCDLEVHDNLGVSKVEFYLDGKNIGTDFNPPFSMQISSDRLGGRELVARVFDLAGNFTQSESVQVVFVD
jgi:membrane carboxypeptidase/penicillin-binding protein PbpC